MKFFSTLIVAALASAATAASVAGTTGSAMKVIMDDFSKLSRLYVNTVTALNHIPQTGASGPTIVHNNEVTIESLFQDVNNQLVVLPTPVSQQDAEKIINTYKAFTPTIIQSLNIITTKASDFESLNAALTMSNDVTLAADSCRAFTQHIMAITPTQMTDEVNTMFTQLTAAREGASAALASVMGTS